MFFPGVMNRYESWTIKKTECRRTDAFELQCWRRFMRVPWTARRSNQSILKEISPEYSLEGLMLKLKLQYFDAKNWFIWKYPDAGKDWRWEKGTTEDEMVGWHHQLNGHGFGWTSRVGWWQGGLVCCDSFGCKESDTTEWLNWTELNWAKAILRKKNSSRSQVPWLQTILQSYSKQNSMTLSQKQKYRSMQQNRKPRNKPTDLWSINLWQRGQN